MATSGDHLHRPECNICRGNDTAVQATKLCKSCLVYLCTDCVEIHLNDHSVRHEVDTLDGYFENLFHQCSLHNNVKCPMYCTQCDSAICISCLASGAHKNHNVQRINPFQEAQDLVRCQICPGKVRKSFATKICSTCNVNLCQECIDLHTIDSTVTHDFITFRHKHFEIKELPCIVHQNLNRDFFCKECDVAICEVCKGSPLHKGHDIKQRRTTNSDHTHPCTDAGKAGIFLSTLQSSILDFVAQLRFVARKQMKAKEFWGNFAKRNLALIPFKSIAFLIVVGIYFNIFDTIVWGEFDFETTNMESSKAGATYLKKYRGAILHGDFRKTKMFQVEVKCENIWNNSSDNNIENFVFQLGLVRKGNADEDMRSMLDGILVSAKYCERNALCLIVEKDTNVVLRQRIKSFSYKDVLNCSITLEFKSNILHIYYREESISIPLARLPINNLQSYDLIAGLGYPFLARSVMAFFGNTKVLSQVHKEMHVSPDGKVLANFDLGPRYKRSSVDFAIPDKMKSRFYIIEYEVYLYPIYFGRDAKDLFEVGIAPMDIMLQNRMLKTDKNTAFFQITLQFNEKLERVFHIYTWENGHINRHLSITQNSSHETEKYTKFEFKFDIDCELNKIGLYMYNEYYLGFDYKDTFKLINFNSTFHPSVGKGISLFPIRIFYSLRKIKPFFF